jgi:hypothetical protein
MDTVFIATVLPSDQCNGLTEALVQYRVIKNQIPCCIGGNEWLNVLPPQSRGEVFATQIPIDGVMSELLQMLR